jgi:hypothetical protein
VGTPDMGRVDTAFDARLLDLLCANSPALCDITDAEMDAAGDGTHEIRNWSPWPERWRAPKERSSCMSLCRGAALG